MQKNKHTNQQSKQTKPACLMLEQRPFRTAMANCYLIAISPYPEGIYPWVLVPKGTLPLLLLGIVNSKQDRCHLTAAVLCTALPLSCVRNKAETRLSVTGKPSLNLLPRFGRS
jgi:hypothetical protein